MAANEEATVFSAVNSAQSRGEQKPPRPACELCHKNKEKCQFSNHQHACQRCLRLNRPCQTRIRRRMGRQPIIRPTPYGRYSLVNLRQTSDSPPKDNFYTTNASHFCDNDVRDAPSRTCASAYCSSDDVVKSGVERQANDVICRAGIPKLFPILNVDPDRYRAVLRALTTEEGFFEAHRHFMLGQTFIKAYRRAVVLVFNHSPSVLADAYLAVLDLMPRRRPGTSASGEVNMTLGAKCLGELVRMASSVQSVGDAAAIITLGQTLLVYNTLIPSPSTRTITRGTLLAVKDWYPTLIRDLDLNSITLAPVIVDTIECLLRRELPVVRLPNTDRQIVDRFIGVTVSLLPLLYDLCELSHGQKMGRSSGVRDIHNDSETNPYSDIEERIKMWAPLIPPDFELKHTLAEFKAILAQADLYRLTALLIIHRLRFPLGMNDELARHYADDIFNKLYSLHHWPETGATGLGLDFPLFVAMVERPKTGLEVFNVFDALRYRKQHPSDILKFLNFVKASYEMGFQGSWLDLVNKGFHGDILP